MPRGGARKGAGRPRGPEPQTLSKLMARDLLRDLVTASLKPLVQRQIAHAMGIGHLYTRDKAGKFTKIDDQSKIDALLAEGTEGEHYWLMSKDPSVQAFTDLLNRALDKPSEHVEVTGAEGGPLLIQWQG
jgi:hypothetical protein